MNLLSETDLATMLVLGEARGESYKGKLAVAYVAQNRLKYPKRYGRTFHEVVLKPYQFSCFNSAKSIKKLLDPAGHGIHRNTITSCMAAAYVPFWSTKAEPTNGATHYCHKDIYPKWRRSKEMVFIKKIGNHVFYKRVDE